MGSNVSDSSLVSKKT